MGLFKLPFETIRTARFDARPNRFVVEATLDTGASIRAFMPNPGRLWELLLPQARLWVTPQTGTQKLRWLVLAVERDGAPVFLHTHINNRVARFLLEEKAAPGFEETRIVRAEATVGRSRFDFLLEDAKGPLYLEVKSCTLFGNGVAMFPDAITERGKRHLEELAHLAERGARSAVLFIVHSARVNYFMPDYHTDLAFSKTMLAVRRQVQIGALSVHWQDDLSLRPQARSLEIPYDYVAREMGDRGIAMVLYDLSNPGRDLPPGWEAGYYLYVEAVSDGLESRMHCLRKGLATTVDTIRFLAKTSSRTHPLAIRSSTLKSAEVCKHLKEKDLFPVKGVKRLFYSPLHPLRLPAFHGLLEKWRMTSPARFEKSGTPEKNQPHS